MRNLENLDNFRINSGRFINKRLPIDKNLSIKDFSRPNQLLDKTYLMKINFEGFLVIKEFIYSFEFSMDLITDRISDIQADVPRDLDGVLKIVKADFNLESSRLIKKIMTSIINFYSDRLEFMGL